LPPTPAGPTQWNAAGYARDREQAASQGTPEDRIYLRADQGKRSKLYILYAGVPEQDFGLWRGSWRQVLGRWGHVATGKGFEFEEVDACRRWGKGLPHSGDWVDRAVRIL